MRHITIFLVIGFFASVATIVFAANVTAQEPIEVPRVPESTVPITPPGGHVHVTSSPIQVPAVPAPQVRIALSCGCDKDAAPVSQVSAASTSVGLTRVTPPKAGDGGLVAGH
jgi:hypothetical protein